MGGSTAYSAPELFDGKYLDPGFDSWAFGVICNEIFGQTNELLNKSVLAVAMLYAKEQKPKL